MEAGSLSLSFTLLFVIVAAVVGGVVAKQLRQPLLLGYIFAGVIFGNIFPQYINKEFIELIADTGVTLLLFTLGVEFSFRRLRRILGVVFWAAASQIILSIGIFLLVFWLSGMNFFASLFIAIAASLSSTAVVIKYLTEKGELDTVPGNILTGWLVIQDLAVIPIMMFLPALVLVYSSSVNDLSQLFSTIFLGVIKAIAAIGIVILFGRFLIPRSLRFVSRLKSREIFLLVVIGIVFLAAAVSHAAGLSAALGAFIAGLLIADTSQNHAIFAEIRPLRNLFAVIFFVSLGLVLPFSYIYSQLGSLLFFAVIVMGVKWFLIYGLCRYLGYHKKTAFLVSVGLTQVSEFGFVIAREGVIKGVLNEERYVFLVALTFLTILISAPLMAQGQKLYYTIRSLLGSRWPHIFKDKHTYVKLHEADALEDHVVICGYGRVGKYVGRMLEMLKTEYVVVDYNHSTIAELRSRGVRFVYGDPSDIDVLSHAHISKARFLVIAIPDLHTQEMVITNAQTLNKKIKIFCRTHFEEDQLILKSLGVFSIVQPEFEASLSIIDKLLPSLGVTPDEVKGKISRLKIEHGLG